MQFLTELRLALNIMTRTVGYVNPKSECECAHLDL
jgi:hypothetical protein